MKSRRFHQAGMKKCQARKEPNTRNLVHKAMQEAMQEAGISLWHSENFAMVAKISQSLRKFRYAQFFAMIATFRCHSKNSLS